MLNQVNHWMEIVATAVDALLLLRVLSLKLHRTYVFITLACVLSAFFDGVQFWLGTESQEMNRVFIYSRFLYAGLFPLIVWDVFEEVKLNADRLRRMAVGRLLYALALSAVFGFLFFGFSGNEEAGGAGVLSLVAVLMWAGSASASLAFLWAVGRRLRMEKMELPNNTRVWILFYELSLVAEVLTCFVLIIGALLNATATDILSTLFLLYGTVITAWCIARLRALPSDVAPASEKAGL
jgi:hypothetical protein